MKIRSDWLIRWVALVGAVVLRVWVGTLSYRYRPRTDRNVPATPGLKGRYIYLFWHENILVPCVVFPQRNIHVLISTHADGEIIAQIAYRLGFSTVRGSSTRGAVDAIRKMLRLPGDTHLAIMPDGPRGPRRTVEPGLILLASKIGMPIILVGVGLDRPWRLKTWDRFCLPRPFSRSVVITSEPIAIPSKLSREQMEHHRLSIERQLTELTDDAERLATSR